MNTLKPKDKIRLEKLFGMGGGYVLWFSDRTMADFFLQEAEIAIDDGKYDINGNSKAKRLREFWKVEDDHLVGKVLKVLIEELENKYYGNQSNDLVPSGEEKQKLIEQCNEIATRLLSGKMNLESLKKTAIHFDSKYLADQIKRMENSIKEEDHELAIGTAKELIETCCKTILAERGKPVKGTLDMPKLTKTTLKELNLVPEGINNEARGSNVVKNILQNLGAIGNELAQLRGLYGTGHGKEGKSSGLSARHAKLAVGAAATLTTFLFDTHEAKK